MTASYYSTADYSVMYCWGPPEAEFEAFGKFLHDLDSVRSVQFGRLSGGGLTGTGGAVLAGYAPGN